MAACPKRESHANTPLSAVDRRPNNLEKILKQQIKYLAYIYINYCYISQLGKNSKKVQFREVNRIVGLKGLKSTFFET